MAGGFMRIAQVAPLYESVPPKQYGGTERVVSYLTEELVKQGHDVTLFASGDSQTSARLIALCPRALRTDRATVDPLARHVLLLEHVVQQADEFDVIHWHCDYLHFPLSRRLGVPQLTTLHGRLDLPDLQPIYSEFVDMPVVSISNAQRTPLPQARWLGTVHHGLPHELHAPRLSAGSYLAFLGRISPEKRVDRAISIATTLGMPIKIAAKIDKADRQYFDQQIAHLLEHPLVDYVGEIGEHEKAAFLGGAQALLFPIDWPEPFGLVMIEAMACGTPTIAYDCGSVREVIDSGVTGVIVSTLDEACRAAQSIHQLDRRRVRQGFERRFAAQRMAADYVKLYERLIEGSRRQSGPRLKRLAAS
jgi:glycosyltransferase involved in cell wall biosynthesis